MSVWDLSSPTNSSPMALLDHEERITAAIFSTDSKWLITVCEGPFVRIWDMANLSAPSKILRGHESGIRAVSISSDNRWLVTGSDDKSVRVWNLNDLSEDPVVLRNHESSVTELAIAADNQWLVTASAYDATRAWTLLLDDIMEMACHTAGRNFTLDEWEQYFHKQPYSKTCSCFPVPCEVIESELERAHQLAKKGDRAGAIEVYRRAVQWVTETDDLDLQNQVSRQVCLDGFVEIAIPACERAG